MAVTLSSRSEITLELFERVAWRDEGVMVAAKAVERVEAARAAFLRLLERPGVTVYGVTSGYGDRAALRLSAEERRLHAAHAAVSGRLLEAVAAMLDPGRGPLPAVPLQGNGGSGEILALGHLFAPLLETGDLGEKEGLALINGSPCAAALIADSALAARARDRKSTRLNSSHPSISYAVFCL